MKISEMTTDHATDVLVRIADPVSNLMHDEKVSEMLDRISQDKAETALHFLADNLSVMVVTLLKLHRADVFEIVAALTDKTTDAIASQPIKETIADIKNSLDGDLFDFFVSAS